LKNVAHVPARSAAREIGKTPVLEVRNVIREYPGARHLFGKGAPIRAVNDVSLQLFANESVGLVGESGCGKSTLLRTILGLDSPQSGEVRVFGKKFPALRAGEMRELRRQIQVVFQDPYGTFDPRWRVSQLIAENFHLFDSPPGRVEARRKTDEILERVGMKSSDADRFPHEFSGGQRQRIAIARALVTEPSIIALDEAVSALDVSIRARILDLLTELSDRLGVSYLFVTHDLSVVRSITDRVLVMRNGSIVEEGMTADVFSKPKHHYTKELLGAVPDLDRALADRLIESS
jgi:peptide/nickel transport system ATP-binding protein